MMWHKSSVKQLSKALHSKDISVAELNDYFYQRMVKLNPELNALIEFTPELMKLQIESAQKQIDSGTASLLTGIPLAHKDLFCTQGVTTTCGSKMLKNFVSPYNATVVENLNSVGMVTLAKANMDEFAMGSSNENSHFGAVKNPWNKDRVPGGSSGGSAVVVASGMAPVATGTDTGGSIRQPAALCGVTGIKPTYGRASRFGMVAFASSLDQAGVFARSAEDCSLALSEMCGFDRHDSTSLKLDSEDFAQALETPLKGKKIGVVKEWMSDLPEDIKALTEQSIAELKDQGADVIEIELPTAHLAVSAYYVLAPAECSSNLSRFDGIRYGHQCESPKDLEDLYVRSRTEGFGAEVKRRIMIGTWALSAGFYDAYYKKAQQVRRLIANDFKTAFESVDVIAAPVSPEVAFEFNSKKDPVSMYKEDVFTIPASLAGLPCLSMPIGFSGGLPVGLQLIGAPLKESEILNVAHQYQQSTDWHTHDPEVMS
jgi:aspartyl-tRNA(Asn)/glutamyl-tRNA(Gln) amidotransferase subunit A